MYYRNIKKKSQTQKKKIRNTTAKTKDNDRNNISSMFNFFLFVILLRNCAETIKTII